jgi:SpoVK/Ycf46/Vps4 family AAA+-type ATPase
MPLDNDKIRENLKFKDIRVYASTEWLAGGSKKYRTVFENKETGYLYVEFSFYNKLFDVKNWSVTPKIVCSRIKTKDRKEQVCEIKTKYDVKKTDNVVYIREGWGNAELGNFWERGDYVWEVYIEDQLVASKLFYIESGGEVLPENNPYFDISDIKLYEAPSKGLVAEKRKFFREFDTKQTRYVWVELSLDNMQNDDWFCELIFNFRNSTGELKGQTSELRRVTKDEEELTFTTGWGADTTGSWHKDKYTLEVVFMGKLIAILPFGVGQKFLKGSNLIANPSQIYEAFLNQEADDETVNETLDEVIAKLDEMVGLKEVKKKIYDYTQYLKFLKLRKIRGFKDDEPINLHLVFTGNPGTGKTTVAKMLGKIYRKLGLLSKGTVHEVTRVELVGQYIGQTAPKVKEIIDSARGGILFIDEAYSLTRSNEDSKDYGHEVIETLVKEMSDGKGDIAIVTAGYPKEMEIFLNSNPGLKSRFGVKIDFPDYLPKELGKIAGLAAKKNDVAFTKEAQEDLNLQVTEQFRNRDVSFGNARMVYTLVEEAKMNMGLRVMTSEEDPQNLTDEQLRNIEYQDVRIIRDKDKKELPNLPIDEELLQDSLAELNSLVGLSQVKEQVNELVKLVYFYKETDKNVLNHFSLHSIFKGNPGTGKTTVARLVARVYKALGILERGHIVECDRQSLVAGYIGQTAIKTQNKIDEALGGVLFIDEAYALTSASKGNMSGGGDFGQEAVETILKQMEDKRGQFIVIVAGYPDNMDVFVEANPGLKSRFDRTMSFEDFSVEELHTIALEMFKAKNLKPDKRASDYLKTNLELLFKRRDKYFGNARTVRKIVLEAIKKQHLRMVDIPSAGRSKKIIETLRTEDLKKVAFKNDELTGKRGVGFKSM